MSEAKKTITSPLGSFTKTGASPAPGAKPGQKVDPSQKAALIRKGNELYNQGHIEMAKRVFLTTSYSDGIIRIADDYFKKGNFFEALKLYHAAPEPSKKEYLAQRCAQVIRHWLEEDQTQIKIQKKS